MEHFVQFEDVSKYYQTGSVRIAAADHLNFYVDKGEFCIIVGPSGAGKTTLLNILGGMDTCDEGHVWLDGQDVSHFSEKELTTYRRYDVGFVFQFYNLVQNLTALENVELASEICRDGKAGKAGRELPRHRPHLREGERPDRTPPLGRAGGQRRGPYAGMGRGGDDPFRRRESPLPGGSGAAVCALRGAERPSPAHPGKLRKRHKYHIVFISLGDMLKKPHC